MIIYLADKLLGTLATLVGVGLLFFVASWRLYVPPPCAPGSPYMVACMATDPALQQYWASLAKPVFDWSSILITFGLFVVLAEVRAYLNSREGLYL